MGSLLFGGGEEAPVHRGRGKVNTTEPEVKKVDAPLVESTSAVNIPTTASVLPADSKTSSNRFADGANQNCGNFITDRPTTRVHAAPGGQSSMGGECLLLLILHV